MRRPLETSEGTVLHTRRRRHPEDPIEIYRTLRQGLEFAKDQGKGDEYNGVVFRAFFQQSRDIGSIDVLADIAKEVGLDPEQFRAALEQGTYRDRVLQLLRTAYERIRVTAVPTMIIGRQRLEGLYPAETMRQVIEGELGREAESSG